MFGYIKPNIPELRVKDHELYKATYCGLCRTMGKCTGCASKFTLSYDFAFFALVRMALEKTQGQVKMRRCMVHPFKKRPIMEINPVLEYSAKSSVILTRLKLKDNVNDSRGVSRLKAKIVGLVSLFFKKTDKRAGYRGNNPSYYKGHEIHHNPRQNKNTPQNDLFKNKIFLG